MGNYLQGRCTLSVMGLSLISFASVAATVTVPGGATLDIDAASSSNDYQLLNGATLNVNGGDQHGVIAAVLPGATVNINAGSTTAAVSANSSTVTVANAAVVSTSASANAAVGLVGSTATITGSTVSSGAAIGLLLANNGVASGSRASVTDSHISGGRAGAQVTTLGDLTVSGSTLTGTGAGSAGLMMFGGQAAISNSSVSGQQYGVRFSTAQSVDPTKLVVDGTAISAVDGAAILLDRNANAVIEINNGSTLSGVAGLMLQTSSGTTATVGVNQSSLVGDIVAETNSTLALTLHQASLEGSIYADRGSNASLVLSAGSLLTGQLNDVSQVGIDSTSRWVMTANSTVGALDLQGGTVVMGQAQDFYRLSLASLGGSGTFVMNADFAHGLSDLLEVSGTASGSHQLLVSASGEEPLANISLKVVQTSGGTAQFSLVGGAVDLGTWSYGLAQKGDSWYLDATTRTISPSTATVLALFNTTPTVWYGELSSLRSRMGELRLNESASGGWLRTYGNKYNVGESNGATYAQTQQGFSLGADAPLPLGDGQWLMGVLAGYSRSDLNVTQGTSGTVDSYYLGAYTTWLDRQTGYYFDGVVKANRFVNDANVSMSDGTRSKGDYHNMGVGGSLEFGRHIDMGRDFFLEPFTQWSAVAIQGRDYTLDNKLQAEGDMTRSVLGKVGSTAGRNIDLGHGRILQPYLRAAVVHEFIKNNEVQVNGNTFNNDLSGTRGELGAGVAVAMSERLQLHADFDYSNGDKLEQPWGANIGLRYNW